MSTLRLEMNGTAVWLEKSKVLSRPYWVRVVFDKFKVRDLNGHTHPEPGTKQTSGFCINFIEQPVNRLSKLCLK